LDATAAKRCPTGAKRSPGREMTTLGMNHYREITDGAFLDAHHKYTIGYFSNEEHKWHLKCLGL
jgi:hypothetical protein